MESGIISLEELYEFARKDPSGKALKRDTPKGLEYGRLVQNLTAEDEDIPNDCGGLYLWGTYKNNKQWENIYIGQSGYSTNANLRQRIVDNELKKEGVFLWRHSPNFRTDEKLIEHCENLGYNVRNSRQHWKRSLRKAGTTRIIWVTTPELTNGQVKEVESDLIETMNPRVNKDRPVPPNTRQQITLKIIGEFRRRIHENR